LPLGKALAHQDNMRVDLTNIFVALCLTILGYYYGLSNGGFSVEDLLPVSNLIVSFCALVIATKALSTWKNQFQHQGQYKSLVSAESCFKIYCTFEEKVKVECLKARRKQGVDFDLPMDMIELRNDKERDYQKSWGELKIHCRGFVNKNSFLAPDNVGGKYLEAIQELHLDTYRPHECSFNKYHEVISKKGEKTFHYTRSRLG
jgi:hypothetical protein